MDVANVMGWICDFESKVSNVQINANDSKR